ncbi:MAG: MFS transporter [Phototrophicaceae bacterium]
MTSIFSKRPSGMNAFYTVWVGQFFSLLGTGMTRFALSLWAWELTGSATALALVTFFGFLPSIVFSPIAGALVDRWDRKLVMMISDLAAGVGTIILFILSLNGTLELWHIYVISLVAGAFESFQFPAYSAAISTMVNKDQYARTSAMLGLANAASGIIAPIAAASLYGILALNGILAVDIVTFLIAYGTLLIVQIPSVKRSAEGVASQSGWLQEVSYGFRFIWERKSLFWLQMSFFFANFVFGMAIVLTNPMILARTGNNETILGIVSASMGVGGLIGGILMSSHGGFKERRVRGVLWGFAASGLFGSFVLGIGQTPLVWIIGAFATSLFLSPINASNQAIWQMKVPPDVQGKVFAARRVIAAIGGPLAMIIAGLLADNIFEPAMQADGWLAPTFGSLVGTGDGAGMGLIMVFVGLSNLLIGVIAYGAPVIREVEDRIPDFDPDLIADS